MDVIIIVFIVRDIFNQLQCSILEFFCFPQEAKQEQSAKLIIDAAAATELVTVRQKYEKLTEENALFHEKIQELEKSRDEQEKTITQSKDLLISKKEEIDRLQNQVDELERYVQ